MKKNFSIKVLVTIDLWLGAIIVSFLVFGLAFDYDLLSSYGMYVIIGLLAINAFFLLDFFIKSFIPQLKEKR